MSALDSPAASISRSYASMRQRWRRSDYGLVWQLGIAVIAIVLGSEVVRPSGPRLALAAAGIALAIGLASRAGPGLIYLLVIWTTVMGTVRRLLSGSALANQADPLLLIAVAAIIVLTVVAAEKGAFSDRNRLTTAILAFDVITFFEAFNPKQGSVVAGLTGLVFLLVPSLAFWIGRALGTDRVITVVLRLLAALGVVVAIYGLIQTFSGFPSWDARWIARSGYSSLDVNSVIRAFGSFASSQEYALYLGVGAVVWVAYGFRLGRAIWSAVAIGVIMTALFYESSRSPLVTTIFAAGLVLAAARLRNSAAALVLGVASVALIPVVVAHFSSASTASNPYAGGLIGHQVSGLVHPFNSQTSSLSGHITSFTHGFVIMFHNPLGLGASAVNIAGAKVSGTAINTEYDPSNVAIALGVPGLLAYLVILVESFRVALRRVGVRRDVLSRAALGIIAVTVLQWTNGGLYAVAFLPWLMMGWLDRQSSRDVDPLRALEFDDLSTAPATPELVMGGTRISV